ncbi:methionine ABC transporter permease [Clostridium aminobutyricum]|uniref:ABC transporter permease n=1 Tax=Clostridium aminobutyricum TaxID=33953 RepID=A0A939DB61_CLOAM|nr:methionine ABC transporter permease [Clostridium aminobutyricum]MBN7774470.1 ABC transporter permease [Clostridium aminobutyricum]
MQELLLNLIPNVMSKLPVFYASIEQTLIMLVWSGSMSFLLGLLFGMAITVTKKDGVLENAFIYQILDKTTNFFRSIPFIILLAALVPLTRWIAGTAIGVEGAIVPLVFGTVPFFTRQIESALAEMDYGLIEAAQSMGSSPIEIIFRVYLKESVAAITRATTIMLIFLIGLTAMAGAVGAGGLGDFAIRFGHQRNQIDVTYVTVLVLVLLVTLIQITGNFIERKSTH